MQDPKLKRMVLVENCPHTTHRIYLHKHTHEEFPTTHKICVCLCVGVGMCVKRYLPHYSVGWDTGLLSRERFKPPSLC